MRTLLFWTHLVSGVTAGSIVLVMSATGVLLTYEKQIVTWSERDYRAAPPSPDALRLPIDELVARVVAARPEAVVTGVTVRSDREAPVMVALAPAGMAFVNPYTGQVLGEGSQGVRGFFRAVTDWHRWLATSGESRATGRAITGAANLVFLLLVMTGAYPLDSTRLVARVGPRRALVSWWPAGTRARLQLAQHDWRLVGRAAVPDCHERRRDVLSLGECARLPGDRQRAAGAAAAPCDATARAAPATGGFLGSRPADRTRGGADARLGVDRRTTPCRFRRRGHIGD